MESAMKDDGEALFAHFTGGGSPFAVHDQEMGGSTLSVQRNNPEPELSGTVEEELRLLVARARHGDREVLPRLRTILDERPELWRHAADLAKSAECAWVELIAGQDGYLSESLARRLADFKARLAGPTPGTPLEELLIERIAVCWLIANYADISYARGKDYSLKQGRYALDRQDRSHRRLLSAIAALTSLRKTLPRGQVGRAFAVANGDPATEGKRKNRAGGQAARQHLRFHDSPSARRAKTM